MNPRTPILLVMAVLLVLLAAPVLAQDDDPATAPAATTQPDATDAPQADGPVVQGVFFFSPTCGHCHYVITEHLPGLFRDNGGEPTLTFDQSVLPDEPAFWLMSNGTLQLLMVDTTQPAGGEAFVLDSDRLGIDQAGVPRIDIADRYLVGSVDIPEQLPGIVADGLANGGIAWPDVPGLDAAIAPFLADGSVVQVQPPAGDDGGGDVAAALPVGPDESPLDRIGRDPVGNGISIVVLVLLAVSLIAAPLLAVRGSLPAFPGWLVPLLAVVGLVVAAYLATIETTGSEAVCGPVGDCNAVQGSEYATLFGIPIGVLGVIGYVAIGGLWVVSRAVDGQFGEWARVLIAAGAFGGTLFSTYLTFLEPFVIGATCLWCITSAIVMLALLWVSAGPGWVSWQRLRGGTPSMRDGASSAPASLGRGG